MKVWCACLSLALLGCGSVRNDPPPGHFDRPAGQPGPLPPGAYGDAEEEPAGWWLRWGVHGSVTSAVAIGEDLLITIDGAVDQVTGSSAPFPKGGVTAARVSSDGALLWAVPTTPGAIAIVDELKRPVIVAPQHVAVLQPDGATLRDVEFTAGVRVAHVAAMADGGLAMAVVLDSLEPSGSLPGAGPVLYPEVPSGIVRYDSQGEFDSFVAMFIKQAHESPAEPLFLGRDGDDGLWAVVSGPVVWDGVEVDLPAGLAAVQQDSRGDLIASPQLSFYGDNMSITSARQGVLVAGGAQATLAIDGAEVPVGQVGDVGSIGVAVGLQATGAPKITVLGEGPHYATELAEGKIVASHVHAAPFRVATCGVGTPQCETYELAGAESSGNRLAVTESGAAYVAGTVRLLPEEQGELSRLYVMRIER